MKLMLPHPARPGVAGCDPRRLAGNECRPPVVLPPGPSGPASTLHLVVAATGCAGVWSRWTRPSSPSPSTPWRGAWASPPSSCTPWCSVYSLAMAAFTPVGAMASRHFGLPEHLPVRDRRVRGRFRALRPRAGW
ncbi:hypothetical protein ACU686_22305 [Yinghuangia aomiensis]